MRDLIIPEHNTSLVCSCCRVPQRPEHAEEAVSSYTMPRCTAFGSVWQRDVDGARGRMASGANDIFHIPKPEVYGRWLPSQSAPASASVQGAPLAPGGGGPRPTSAHEVAA